MSIPDLLSIGVIFIAAPLAGLVAALLWRLSRTEPTFKTLRAHAILSLALLTIVTVFAAIFVNNGLADPPLDTWATQVITRGTLLVVSTAASLYWLWFVWRNQ